MANQCFKKAGIDRSFGAHSVRHASSTKAALQNVPVDHILSTVGWSSERTFANFSSRPVEIPERDFADAVLT